MYKEKDEVNENKLPAWICVVDEKNKSAKYHDTYNKKQIVLSEQLYNNICNTYNSRVWRNYRKIFIAIKVEHGLYPNSKQNKELTQFCERNNIEIKKIKKSVIYRIPKKA